MIDLTTARDLLLSTDEKQRAARFHFEQDRIRWSRARSALREELGRRLVADPMSLSFVVGPHGKPALEHHALEFNISHAGDYAMIAFCASPVGVDIERIRPEVEMSRLLVRLGEDASPEEPATELFRRWARREARSKAVGGSLMTIPPVSVVAIDIGAPEGYVAATAMVPVYTSELS